MNPIHRLVLIVVLGGVFVLIAVNYVKRPSKPQIVRAALERSPAGYINRDRQAFVAQKLLAMEQQSRASQSSQLPPPRMPPTRPPGNPSAQPPASEQQSSQEPKAQPKVEEIIIPPDIVELANQLLPPTNEIVHMMGVRAEVRGFDSKGLLLKTNFDYMPRFAITNLSEGDLALLLENKIAYSSLTTFGTSVRRTEFSRIFENRLRQIWLQGKTLKEKVQTRIALVSEMQNYNDAVRQFNSQSVNLNQAKIAENRINGIVGSYQSEADSYAGKMAQAQYEDKFAVRRSFSTMMGSESAEVMLGAMEAQRKADAAASSAQSIENQINQTSRLAFLNAQRASASAVRLTTYGISVPDKPPFTLIPPLSMRLEIDAERITNQKKTAP